MLQCKICNKEFGSYTGLASHINLIHKITSKDYYIKYLKTQNEGICPVCGKETNWFSLRKGFRKHCSRTCSTADPEVYKLKSETEFKNTGYHSPMEDPKHHQKMIELSRLPENQQKRIESCKNNNGQGTGFQIKSVKENAIDSIFNKYGKPHVKISLSYTYNNLIFDSSWELAYYIWLTDNNIKFEYQPNIYFEYTVNNKIHKYFPDFCIENKLYEIKGTQFFNESGEFIDPYKNNMLKAKCKYQCMLDNNVKILKEEDIKPILKYITEKYGKDYLKQFKIE